VARILLIDDDTDLTDFLRPELETSGHVVECLDRAEQGPDLLGHTPFDLVLLDHKMPGMTGIDFLDALRALRIEVPVILMTSYSDSETAIRAMNLGAFDYLVKPGSFQELVRELGPLIGQALEITRPAPEVRVATAPRPAGVLALVVGKSRSMLKVCKTIGLVARGGDPVLILGETGTGKELVAKAIHANSPRKVRPMITINCAAVPAGLLESELFGHEKGAFTGADKLRKGKIEHANGSTLFLDEIGDMPLELQTRLLRVIEYQEFERVGGDETIKVNVRVLSATRRDLEAAIREGKFRDDLYFRLKGVELRLPSLRERLEDLPELVEYFLDRAADENGRPKPSVAEASWARLKGFHWPGNVRQLQKVVSAAVVSCRGPIINPSHLEFPAPDGEPAGPAPGSEADALASLHRVIEWAWTSGQAALWPLLRDQLERELLRTALERTGGNQSEVSRRLDVSRQTVGTRIQQYGLG
jgi:DNA-binding NtrC family response regulator